MSFKNYIPTPLRNILKKMVFAYRSWLIRKQGLAALKEVFDIINKDKPKAFAAFGTLLGLYREQSLLGHDIDIDIGVFHEDLQDTLTALEKAGITFSFYFQDTTYPNCLEYRFFYKKIPFDIFVFNRIGDDAICTDFVNKNGVFMIRENVFEDFELDYIEVDGYRFCVPKQPEKFLLGRYGETYMTPDKSYDYKNPAPCIRNTDRVAKMYRL